MTITLLQGDCRAVLPTLKERSVQCVVTSPPYFGLRRYDVDGNQIGIEPTPAEYVQALVGVFREVRRVLRDDGVLWLNLGDSYAGSWGNYAPGGIKNQQRPQTESGKRWDRKAYGDTTTLPATARVPGLPEKNLIGIPWRVAFALQEDGWILRSDVIWSKPNCMPESVTDRPTRSHEYLFLFAKQARYFYDAAAIAEAALYPGDNRAARTDNTQTHGRGGDDSRKRTGTPNGTTRNRRTVWTVATAPYAGAHFATFPEKLIEPCILAGSSPRACEVCGAPWERVVERESNWQERKANGAWAGNVGVADNYQNNVHGKGMSHDLGGGTVTMIGWRPTCRCDSAGSGRCIVLDPFVGSGTTCRVAEKYGRDSIGIDLGYEELQEQRTNGVQIHMEALL